MRIPLPSLKIPLFLRIPLPSQRGYPSSISEDTPPLIEDSPPLSLRIPLSYLWGYPSPLRKDTPPSLLGYPSPLSEDHTPLLHRWYLPLHRDDSPLPPLQREGMSSPPPLPGCSKETSAIYHSFNTKSNTCGVNTSQFRNYVLRIYH